MMGNGPFTYASLMVMGLAGLNLKNTESAVPNGGRMLTQVES